MNSKDETTLNKDDIQKLISESEQFRKLESIKIDELGLELDVQSGYVFLFSIIVWIALWFGLGLFKLIPLDKYFFLFYIILSGANFLNSATNVADAETERVNLASQQSFIQGGIAVFILVFVFLYQIPMSIDNRSKVYKILILCLVICCLPIIIINVKNDSVNIRSIRKIQQAIYNQGLVLFLLSLAMIYYYNSSFDSSSVPSKI